MKYTVWLSQHPLSLSALPAGGTYPMRLHCRPAVSTPFVSIPSIPPSPSSLSSSSSSSSSSNGYPAPPTALTRPYRGDCFSVFVFFGFPFFVCVSPPSPSPW